MTENDRPQDNVVESAASALSRSLSGRVSRDVPLGPLTSLKVGGAAALLAEPENEGDLLAVASVATGSQLPMLVLGRGTNVLVSDSGFAGVVIRLGKGFEWIRGSGEIVEAGAATPLPQAANWAARRGLTGMEFGIAIPASVGGAIRMNAGAHMSEVSAILVSVRVCRLAEGRVETVSKDLLEMNYRSTLLGSLDVVCAATFHLAHGETKQISDRMKQHRLHRVSTQPADQPNAGSFFKNPPGSSAGFLIEETGLKGFSVGRTRVSDKHANFLVAEAGATAQDVYDLMAVIQSRVLERTGILLHPEVRIIGSFDTSQGCVRTE